MLEIVKECLNLEHFAKNLQNSNKSVFYGGGGVNLSFKMLIFKALFLKMLFFKKDCFKKSCFLSVVLFFKVLLKNVAFLRYFKNVIFMLNLSC